ncbi:MAG TPA: tRNA (cytidine(34)-2'-O)-methyltransferase [Bacillota bacterium]|nr:tRNA (cytidine(34)-2'-O)-methyltransferase [Bacillota bacterium]
MADIHIALHEPEIPQNTGNIARTCSVTGCALHLIEPLGFQLTDAKLKRAGLDYWDELETHSHGSIEELEASLDGYEFVYFTTKASKCYSDHVYSKKVCLVFGKETKGLPEELLRRHPERCVRIPMLENRRSLNLSNSAAIAVYEVLRQRSFINLEEKGYLL